MGPALRTLLFTIVAPGTVTVALPYFILTRTHASSIGPLRSVGIPVVCLGIAIYAWCAWSFTVKGRGTPAPIDPPKKLVIEGLYRYMRNPMYVGVLTILVGEVLWFASPMLLVYAGIVAGIFHAFIRFYEERKLQNLFGGQYTAYCNTVPRWWPRLPRRTT